MSLLEGTVGPQVLAEGVASEVRLGRNRELVVQDAHGRYYEASARGRIFSSMTAVAGTAIVAANVSPIAAGAASVLSLFNPLGSGVNLAVLKTWLQIVSAGAAPVGAWVYNMAFNQSITATQNNGGTAGAPSAPCYLSGVSGVGKVFTQTALTGSGAQVLLRFLSATIASGATPSLNLVDAADGDVVVPPGGLLSIAAPSAGTATVVIAGMEWEEVPA